MFERAAANRIVDLVEREARRAGRRAARPVGDVDHAVGRCRVAFGPVEQRCKRAEPEEFQRAVERQRAEDAVAHLRLRPGQVGIDERPRVAEILSVETGRDMVAVRAEDMAYRTVGPAAARPRERP